MWTKGNWNIIHLTLTLTRYYLYSNDLHVVMEWCPQKWNSQIEDTILLYSINEGKSSGSLHNLTWAYHHNEDILSCFDTDFVSQMKLTKLPLIRSFDGDLILMRSDTVWVERGLLTKRWSQNKNKHLVHTERSAWKALKCIGSKPVFGTKIQTNMTTILMWIVN